jgi:hypothetical protein
MTSNRAYAAGWSKDDPYGSEFAELRIGADRLSAVGVAIGNEPEPYRLDYSLETAAAFVTARVEVETRGPSWRRRLVLERRDGVWTAATESDGGPGLPAPGGDMSRFDDALDPDLALSPVFNTMPVLRHRLLAGGSAPELLMVWISVPDLAVHPSPQRYTYAGARDALHVVRFESDDFAEDILYDDTGVVVDYPGIARRLRRRR